MFKVIILICLFVVVPLLVGAGLMGLFRVREGKLSDTYLMGLFFSFASYECIYSIMVFKYCSLSLLTTVWGILIITLIILGIILYGRTLIILIRKWCDGISTISLIEIGCIVTVIAYLIMTLLNQQEYTDDTIFVNWASTSYATDTLIRYSPYTGKLITIMESTMPKYLLSGYCVFIASLAKLFELKPVIIMHIVIPIVMTPIAYLLYYKILRLMCGRKQAAIAIVVLVLINCFSIYTGYEFTTSTWMYVGMWYNKALTGNISIPAIWYYAIMAMDVEKTEHSRIKYWAVLFCVCTSAVFFSTFGSIITMVLMSVITLYYLITKRKFTHILGYMCAISTSIIAIVVTYIIK